MPLSPLTPVLVHPDLVQGWVGCAMSSDSRNESGLDRGPRRSRLDAFPVRRRCRPGGMGRYRRARPADFIASIAAGLVAVIAYSNLPPGRKSSFRTVVVKPSGHHHASNPFLVVQASQTSSTDARKVRSRLIFGLNTFADAVVFVCLVMSLTSSLPGAPPGDPTSLALHPPFRTGASHRDPRWFRNGT